MKGVTPDDEQAIAELTSLRNLGPASARWLVAAGIRSRRDLERMGAMRAFHRVVVHRAGMGASINLLYAVEGALRDVPWDSFTAEEREYFRRAAERPPE